MEFVDYVFTGGVSFELRTNTDEIEKIKGKAKNHASKVILIRRYITSLMNCRINDYHQNFCQ